MAEVRDTVITVRSYDIVGLTQYEYQVIRNALYNMMDDREYTQEFGRGETESQGAVATRLHSEVIVYKPGD